jgi:hypothetical protein
MDLTEKNFVVLLLARIYALVVFSISFIIPSKKDTVLMGGFAQIKFSRWSDALNRMNISSKTIVPSYQKINKQTDWDYVWMDFVPKIFPTTLLRKFLAPAFSWFWIVRHARVICSPIGGISFFSWVNLSNLELLFFRLRKIKVVAVAGGGDAYMLGLMRDPSLRHALQSSYPDRSRIHSKIEKRLRMWEERADIFIAGTGSMVLDGFARSDLIAPHLGVVDFETIPRPEVSLSPIRSGRAIRILHAPNHRFFKGTEFIQLAVDNLISRGFNVELEIIEETLNSEVLKKILGSDIVVDQVLLFGYTNFAIECMALGKPVICNLTNQSYRELMTRYSFLGDCPIVSATPESLEESLEALIKSETLRIEIGEKSANYARVYHSYASWQRLWSFLEALKFDGATLVRSNYFHPQRDNL